MSFSFNTGIPAAANNPSNDQPIMLTNNIATAGIIAVDHIGFNTAGGGQHKQITYNTTSSPAAPSGTSAIAYTAAGTLNTTPQQYFVNSAATYLLNALRAFGTFTRSASPVSSFNNSYNCASISGSLNTYTITLNSNVVTGNSIAVIVYQNSASGTPNYTFVNPTLTITGVGNSATDVTFIVLQN